MSTFLALCDGSKSVAAACGSFVKQGIDGEDENMDAEVDDFEEY